MTEQWQELKETITEMRDNDGTGTQQEVCKFLANLMDVLEKQINDGWIPVSERMPEEDGQYLVTITNGDIARYVFNKNGNSLEYWRRCAIAWMPLPKPYDPQESEGAE